jgi:hypothetical protein
MKNVFKKIIDKKKNSYLRNFKQTFHRNYLKIAYLLNI